MTYFDIASVPINMCNGFPVEFLPIIQASRVQFIELEADLLLSCGDDVIENC